MKETLKKFKEGPKDLKIVDAVSRDELTTLEESPSDARSYSQIKFVPASGAATRMFKDLYAYLDDQKETAFVEHFFKHLEEFAFFGELKENFSMDSFDRNKKEDRLRIVQAVLDSEMKYGDYPKALIDFHVYESDVATPIDEHIYEAKRYLEDDQEKIHFTIAKKDEDAFIQAIETARAEHKNLEIDYSFQEESTNTLAVDLNNEPFLLENGEILYRPGGHGALINNLNELKEDIIFIKNIDNVCHQSRIEDTVASKKKLEAIGLSVKEKIDQYLKDLSSDDYDLEEIIQFIEDRLHIHLKEEWTAERAYSFLNRPLRVAGVVKNEGEPGGGPFIVDNGDYRDLQICETTEINQENPEQLAILEQADFFNPVDLVCFVKDYKGDKFNLLDFVNEDRYFISEKSHQGRPLKALEHPGLWNGAMHDWNTVFVEVPLSTFNPVKTVNDLLKEGHQPK